MPIGPFASAADQGQSFTDIEPHRDNDDCASDNSPETDYSEVEDGDVATEELYQEYAFSSSDRTKIVKR